jgi:dTDP-glucose 4,6-dehydratase
MRILVTGGLGTVGKVLVWDLRRRGHEVCVSDRGHHHDPMYQRCDVSSYAQLVRLFERGPFDVVYHLAAEFGRWNGEDFYDSLWNTNVVGTKNMIRLQQQHGFRLIFFSSSEVYGDYDGVMSEDVMEKVEIRQMNDYAMTKWVSEQQIMNAAAQFGLESVRVRLFNTYGPGEYYSPYRSAVCKFIYHAMFGQPYTVFLGHHRTSTYVTDIARTLANIVENFKPGEVYNIGGTEYHDMKEVSDIILNHVGRSDSFVTYVEGEPFTTKDKKVDVSKAIRDLDHKCQVSMSEGLPRTIDWMRSTYGQAKPNYVGLDDLEKYL